MKATIFAALISSLFATSIPAKPVHSNFIKGHRQSSTGPLNMSGPVSSIPFPPVKEFQPDLDAYFARIKYTGSRNTALETLQELQLGQLKSIPFENLDVHIGRNISPDPDAVEMKLVRNNRGGYCFEQNVLLLHVLRALGYKVTPLTARVLFGKPTDRVSGLTHILLRVECEGLSWLVDVGFGHYGPLKPLLMGLNGVESEPHGAHRIVSIDDDNFKLQVHLKGDWEDLYRYNLLESYPSDWEIGSHYCSTYEHSKFVNNIIVTRFADTSLYVLVNKEFTIRKHMADGEGDGNGVIEKRNITSQGELTTILNDFFDIKIGDGVPLCPPGTTWEEL